MTHVVTEKCIKCKYMECIQVCPTSCFHEGENMLVINPERCIDCGLCIPQCPINAIEPHTTLNMEPWIALNTRLAASWPVITIPGIPPTDADQWVDVSDKLKYLNEKPGKDD